MSFFDDASLVFLPSGEAGKDGKAYSMKPTNGDGDFTFSRGSNLTSTRIDSNGLIEKGRENLLLQSNQFDTTWTTFNASVTSGQSGYDGSSDAWLLNATGASGVVRQTISLSGVQTFSIYAKQGTADAIEINSFSNVSLKVNLTNGSVITSGSANINSSVTSISNGYYRITITANGSATIWRVYISKTSGSVTSGDNIYIQDAQLEIGLTSTEYIESGASTGLAGLLEDSPRFDYSGGASCPSLLLEPSRTNLIDYSEYLQNALTQGQVDITFTPNYGTSPEGVKNSTRIQFADNSAYAYKAFTITADTTASMYVKGTSGETFRFGLADNAGAGGLLHTFSGEWERISNTRNTNAQLVFSSYGGTALDFEAYGLQVEEGSYSTSYIPNHSGGSVTRNAESFSGAGTSSTFNDSEGVLYAEIAALADDLTFRMIVINDGSNANRVLIRYRSTSNVINFSLTANSSTIRNVSFSVTDITDYHKVAIKYKDRDIGIFIDGAKVATYNDTFSLSSLDNLSFVNYNGDDSFYGKTKQVLYFPTALSDNQCIALTS